MRGAEHGEGEGEAVCLPVSMKGYQSEGKMERERGGLGDILL